MRLKPFSYARYKRLGRRQSVPLWGPNYVPGILASRDEAPSISRPSLLYSVKLLRELHFLSIPEREACLFALHNGAVFEIKEQHVLHPFPAPHPLVGHPEAEGLDLLPVQGTLAVAMRMGTEMFRKHPIVIWSAKERLDRSINSDQLLPISYIGDFLVFLRDENGAYVLNWTVKATPDDFYRYLPHDPIGRLNKLLKKQDKDDSRHRLEEAYFRDAGIRTVRISASELDRGVVANLTDLACQAGQPEPLDFEKRQEMVELFRRLLGTRTTVLSRLSAITRKFHCTGTQAITILLQAIWARKIRVDLHKPILVDRPLVPERLDIFDEYAHFFRRGL